MIRSISALLFGALALALASCAGVDEASLPGAGCQSHEEGLAYWRQGDYAAAARCWRPRAEAGNARDAMALGMALDRMAAGTQTPLPEIPNPLLVEAEEWLYRSARRQLPAAEYELGQFIANHWCYPLHRRCEEARDILKKALIAQSDRAGFALATLLSTPGLPILDYELAYRILYAHPWEYGRTTAEEELYTRILPIIPAEVQNKNRYIYEINFISANRYNSKLFTGDLSDFKSSIELDVYNVYEDYRRNFPEYCILVRRMAEDGDLMAMYFYGRMLLSYDPRYDQKPDTPCLQGDGDLWLYKAIDNGLTLALGALSDIHHPLSYPGHSIYLKSESLDLYERAYKMGDSYYALKISKSHQGNIYLLERVYFAYSFYFSESEQEKAGFIAGRYGDGIRTVLQHLSEETKQRIEREARSFEPDYP